MRGTFVASFTYDGDGNRVQATVDGTTTTFVGGYYEVTGSTVTKYYFAGAQRVAMRKYTIPQSMAVEYFLGDHLGSTSVTTDSTGAKVSEIRYKPWGEIRSAWTSGAVTTPAYKLAKYLYTGQFSYLDDPTTAGVTEGFGLMFYNARWYDPSIGRFAQADTIVPGGVQGLDRYAYVNNDPMRYTDPSGHKCVGDDAELCSRKQSRVAVLPDVYGFSHHAGKRYVTALENELGDFGTIEEMLDNVVVTIVDWEAYSFKANEDFENFISGVAEAVTRKVWDFYHRYGIDGAYAAIGSYETVRRRVDLYYGTNTYGHNSIYEQKTANITEQFHRNDAQKAFDNGADIGNWRAGGQGNRPYEIGNFQMAIQYNEVGLVAALYNNAIGSSPTEVYWRSGRGIEPITYILTLDQIACHDPKVNICPAY